MIELKIGDKVMHYIDDIEGYRTFEIEGIELSGRYVLKGIDTATNLSRNLDNDIPDKRFHYMKVSDHE
jgi:hypothetical protein